MAIQRSATSASSLDFISSPTEKEEAEKEEDKEEVNISDPLSVHSNLLEDSPRSL